MAKTYELKTTVAAWSDINDLNPDGDRGYCVKFADGKIVWFAEALFKTLFTLTPEK